MKRLVATAVIISIAALVLYTTCHGGRTVRAPATRGSAGALPLAHAVSIADAWIKPANAVVVTGSVFDVLGGPIVGARIRVRQSDRAPWWPAVETDRAGAFTCWTPAGTIEVEASADGYATAVANNVTAPGHTEFTLAPESSIDGRVVDSHHQPVEGAQLEAVEIDFHGHAVTAADGTFHLGHLQAGRFKLLARTAHAYGTSAGSVGVALGQHVTGVEIRVDVAARITGHLTPSCPDPAVKLHDPRRQVTIEMIAEPDHQLHADGVPDGIYVAHPVCEGFIADVAPLLVVSGAKDLGPITWTMKAGVTIHGHVRDPAGAPLAGIEVIAHGDPEGFTESADDGSYAIIGLAATTYDVEANADSGASAHATVIAPDVQDFTIVEDGATIRGTVVDPVGAPVAVGVYANGGHHSRLGTAAADGSFSMTVRPDVYKVAAGEDSSHPLGDEHEVTVAANQIVTLKLVVPARNGVIRGDVVDGNGHPVGDAWVTAYQPGALDDFAEIAYELHPKLTAEDGTFAIEHLAAGTYTLNVDKKGGGNSKLSGVTTGSTVHMVIPSLATLSGIATYPEGTHPDRMSITMRVESEHFYREEEFYHSNGAFELTDLPAGVLRLALVADDGNTITSIVLAAGQHQELQLPLDHWVTVRGRVVDPAKHPLAGLFIFARSSPMMLGATADADDPEIQTAADGTFAVRSPRGPITLDVSSPYQFSGDQPRHCGIEVVKTVTGPLDVGDIMLACAKSP